MIACATDGMIASISRYYMRDKAEYQLNEDGSHSWHLQTGEIFPLPWPSFRDDVQLRIQARDPAGRLSDLRERGRLPSYDLLPYEVIKDARPIFVSRMPNRKVSGPAHKETVKGIAVGERQLLVKRTAIENLKLKEDEIANYYRPNDDLALYKALKDRLAAHDGDGKKAFASPICKPGSSAPVRKVKVYEASTLSVPVHHGKGAADNGSMVRIDIFQVDGDGYYLIPIYVADTVKPQLPMLACVANKPYEQWKIMKEQDFIFSLYPNDLIYIEAKLPIEVKLAQKDSKLSARRSLLTQELLYYTGCNISNGKIVGCTHDNAYMFDKGLKTLKSVKKLQVDALGYVSPVHQERRMPFK